MVRKPVLAPFLLLGRDEASAVEAQEQSEQAEAGSRCGEGRNRDDQGRAKRD